jgi:hypothetical protein
LTTALHATQEWSCKEQLAQLIAVLDIIATQEFAKSVLDVKNVQEQQQLARHAHQVF